MRKTVRFKLMAAALLVAGFQSGATTEIFNLAFSNDIPSMVDINNPVVPTGLSLDTWVKSTVGHAETVVDGESLVNCYMFNGNVRGIAIALSSGFTPGTRYTLSARARKFYGGGNQRVVIAATQADAGSSGDYLVPTFYNGAAEAYQPVAVNSGDASVSNVLTSTLNVNSSWQTVAGTFVFDGAAGPNLVVQLQCFDTGGTTDGAIYYDDFILSDNRPPQFSSSLIELTDAFLGVEYFDTIASLVTDLEGDGKSIIKDPADTSWVTISNSGAISGTPDSAGTNDVTVLSWDDQGSETNSATLRIVVLDVNAAPVWSVDNFDMGYVAADLPYSDSIAGRAFDPNGNVITFAEAGSGPAWLNIATNGAISGTPSNSDLGTNSWSVSISDGEFAVTSSFEIVVIEGTPVYQENFSPSVDMVGFFNNTVGTAQQAYYMSELQAGMWGHTFSTNSDSYNLWDTAGLTDVLEFAENGSGNLSEGVGTVIPEGSFGGLAGRYVLTYSFVTNNAYDAVSSVGARIYEAARGPNASSTNDYFLKLQGSFVFNLGVDKPAGSEATFSLSTNDTVSSTLGARTLEFDYSGSNDVALIFGTVAAGGRGRVAIDNVRVFKIQSADPYGEWATFYELTEGKYGDDDLDGVDNITEYGLGLNPKVAGGVEDGALPELSNNGAGLVYVMAQRNNDTSLVFNLLTTDNLIFGPWNTNNTPTDYTVSGTGSVGSFDYVTNLIDTTVGAKFVKPQVTETP